MEIYKEFDCPYILERNDKKLVVFVCMAIFVSYCHSFRVFIVIYKVHDTQYMFDRHYKKIIIFVF
jgi:hypothetical protein